MSKPSLTAEGFLDLLPASLRAHVTPFEVDSILHGCCIHVDSVNGCSLEEMQAAVPLLRAVGITAIACSDPEERLLSIEFLKS